MKFRNIAAALALSVGIAGMSAGAQAGLMGVKEIRVFSAIPDWLQISEVVALQTGTGIDMALASNGATAQAGGPDLTNWTTSNPAFAIDGIAPAAFPNMYHPGASNGPLENLLITLAAPTELDAIGVFGRTGGFSSRDIYNVLFYDMNGNLLHQVNNLDARGSSNSAFAQLPNTRTDIPEPGMLALFGLGLVGIRFAARGKRAG